MSDGGTSPKDDAEQQATPREQTDETVEPDELNQQEQQDDEPDEDGGEDAGEEKDESGEEQAASHTDDTATAEPVPPEDGGSAEPSEPLSRHTSSEQPDEEPPSQPQTERSTQQESEISPSGNGKEDEEEKQPSNTDAIGAALLPKVRSTVSTGMQSEAGTDPDAPLEDDETEQDGPETANAQGQTGEQLEPLQSDSQQLQQNGGGAAELPVEITIMPDGFKHLELFRGEESIATVKSILSERFKLDPTLMRLALGDLVLEDNRALQEYREFDVARMGQAGVSNEEIQATPLAFTLNIELADGATGDEPQREEYKMPDIIKVVINREELEIEAEEEEEKELSGSNDLKTERTPEQVVYVQVIRDNLHHPKPFLGGFRHKYYGTIYHHSSTQTARKKKKIEVVKFHRETQTIQIISRSQQTNREAGTQMERRDLLQDHSNDSVIMSKPYFTADELEALRDEKAREVQCFLRQCFAWRRVRRLRESKAEKLEQEIRARSLLAKQQAENHARQIQRRMHPRTREDFAVLFTELEAWRLHETSCIKESGLSAEEIASALQELLNKEVKLLQTIDRLKITAARENKWSRTQSSLEKMASPKEWSSSEGDLIEVETPFTIRAKELVDLYNGLCLRNLSRAQRVDVLLHIKYTVKEFDCELSREIVELIKREEDLLRRQRSEQSLEGLRKRLQNLFLNFVNTPTFNPAASNFSRVPEDGGVSQPTHALSSSLARPAMLTRTNTITLASNVAGRIFSDKGKK